MTLHVCVLGIDGSGKSTISIALPAILAAETSLVAGVAGETFRVSGKREPSTNWPDISASARYGCRTSSFSSTFRPRSP